MEHYTEITNDYRGIYLKSPLKRGMIKERYAIKNIMNQSSGIGINREN